MFDLRLILQFVTVAECLSFSAAAARLGVSQPRLSTQIRKLEEFLGTPLFERTTRKVALTHHGAALLDKARAFAREAEILSDELASHRRGLAGAIRIGMVNLGEADPRLPQLIARFALDHEGAEIDTQPGLAEAHEARLFDGSLDLAFGVDLAFGPDLETVPVFALEFAVMFASDDPLARLDRIAPHDLAGRQVAMTSRPRNPVYFDTMNAPLLAAGAIPLHVPELRRSLLNEAKGLIVTTVVAAPASADLRYGAVRRPVSGVRPFHLVMARARKAAHPRAVERFWRHVIASAASF
jgi:DNA-binding transcriptional LysR family regulator